MYLVIKIKVFLIYIYQYQFESEMKQLLISDYQGNSHYIDINDFNRFNYKQSKQYGERFFYMFCLHYFTAQEIRDKNKLACIEINGKQAINLPQPTNFVDFKSYQKKLIALFAIYADFESTIIPREVQHKDETMSHVYETQKHKIDSYGNKVICG